MRMLLQSWPKDKVCVCGCVRGVRVCVCDNTGCLTDTFVPNNIFISTPDLRSRFRVSFVNAQGLDELGIDGGGLFREFLNEVLKTGFDPNRGYFSTTQDGLLYPNPQVCECDQLSLY